MSWGRASRDNLDGDGGKTKARLARTGVEKKKKKKRRRRRSKRKRLDFGICEELRVGVCVS